jgi:dienelactone hydrolase
MKRVLLVVVCLCMAQSAWSMTPDERAEYGRKLIEILPPVPTRADPTANSFKTWVEQSKALPPDFDALPKVNTMPDAFTFFDGKRKVTSAEDWKARREEIKQLFEKYVIGTMPPKPTLDKIVPVDPAAAAAAGPGRAGGLRGRGGAAPAEGTVTKIVDLYYGPNSEIVQRVTVNIPPGPGPFPVLMGGQAGITSRGYISCTIPSNVDNPPDIGKYYPEYTWGSMGKCAWSTRMVVDYLYTLPEVDKQHIAITGYSRGGKYATISAAWEDRIAAVVAGSTGVGGVLTWRQGSEKNIAESIESTTRMFPIWFTTGLRFFAGREDRLPVDGNLLVALVAPRSLLNLYGINDEVNSTWGNEQSHYNALKVYEFLGQPDRLSLLHPPGHHGANDQNATMNWLDIQFGKSTEKWTNDFLFPWSFDKWKQTSGESGDISRYAPHPANEPISGTGSEKDWNRRADLILGAVRSMLGVTPTNSTLEQNPVSNPGDPNIDDTPRWVIGRSIIEHGWTRQQAAGIATRDIRFGPGKIRGDLYYKEGTPEGTKLPTVVFLHGNSYPLGYMWVYRMDPHPIIALVNAGYAVLAFDQSGFGSRMNEAATFYEKYPKWSQMGRMIEDARAAVSAVQKDAICDPNKVYLFGYGLGGSVALHTAALEVKVKGVVSICGYTPMRTDTPDKNTGGIAQYSHERGIMPRLGFFIGQESRIPYDYHELIATIAPRPVYIFSPLLNRDATPADVHASVDQARKAYELYGAVASSKLVLDEPFDYFRLSGPAQDRIVEWMGKNMH